MTVGAAYSGILTLLARVEISGNKMEMVGTFMAQGEGGRWQSPSRVCPARVTMMMMVVAEPHSAKCSRSTDFCTSSLS